MLVVVAIIGIITSLALGSMYAATERARRTRTEILVRKLHLDLIRRWESYETRRLPIVMGTETLDVFALRQLRAQRELMRMEMPDRYSDFWFASTEILTSTPLRNAYERRIKTAILEYDSSINVSNPTVLETEMLDRLAANNQSAELLYLILSTPIDGDDVAGRISEKYVGDTDGDLMPEFVDAWGNPIEWIRWPAGYLNVDALGVANPDWGYVTDMHMVEWGPGVDGSLVTDDDAITDPDPFDVRGTDQFLANGADRPPASEPDTIAPPARLLWGYRLVPLILSAGPDGEHGVAFGRSVDPAGESTLIDEYSKPYYFWEEPTGSGTYIRRGTPRPYDFSTQELSDDGVWVHFDNITNHLMEAR